MEKVDDGEDIEVAGRLLGLLGVSRVESKWCRLGFVSGSGFRVLKHLQRC